MWSKMHLFLVFFLGSIIYDVFGMGHGNNLDIAGRETLQQI